MIQPGETIVFEGDSLTQRRMRPALDNWAYLRLNRWHESYPELVEEWLFCLRPEWRVTCRCCAVGGSNVRDVRGRWETMVAPLRPDLVVMTLGNNDPNQGVSVEEFGREFAAYADGLQKLTGGRILFLGGFLPLPDATDEIRAKRAGGAPYHAVAKRVVEEHGGRYLDVGPVLCRKAEALKALYDGHTLYADGSHFNAVGNRILAGMVLDALGVLALPGL